MNKFTKDEWLKKQEDFYEKHVKYHPANVFCGTAGEEEMRHIEQLVSKLSDNELKELVTEVGMKSVHLAEIKHIDASYDIRRLSKLPSIIKSYE